MRRINPRVADITLVPAAGSAAILWHEPFARDRASEPGGPQPAIAGARLFREDPPVDARRPDIVAQVRRHPPGPRITRPRLAPGLALRNLGMLELVQRQVLRLTFDNDEATSAKNPRHGQISRDVDHVVPVVELLLDRGGDVDAPIC